MSHDLPNVAGGAVRWPCHRCGETLSGCWSANRSSVLWASAYCQVCRESRIIYDNDSLSRQHHCEMVDRLCDLIEAASAAEYTAGKSRGKIAFSEADRGQLKASPLLLSSGDWQGIDQALQVFAGTQPSYLTCCYESNAERDAVEVFLCVRPAAILLLGLVVTPARFDEELGWQEETDIERDDDVFLPEHIVRVWSTTDTLSDQHISAGVEKLLTLLAPQLATLPIDWLPLIRT